jgi:hypothetical protein
MALSEIAPETLKKIFARPIAFHRCLAELCDSALSGLFLSQLCYWSSNSETTDGWFYKTRDDWRNETGMSRSEQETARKALRNLGILKEKRQGLPRRLWFKIDFQILWEKLSQQVGQKPADWKARNAPTKEENNTEIKDPPALFDLENNQIKLPPKSRWPEGFEDFWFAYPAHRRGDKRKTAKIFLTEIKTSDCRTRLMEGLERWKKSEQWEKDDGDFVLRADRFLERHQWEIMPRIGKREFTAEEDREHEAIMKRIEQEAQRRAAERLRRRNAPA